MASEPWSRETWLAVILVIAAVVLIPTVLFLGIGGGGGGMMGGGAVGGWGWFPMLGVLGVFGVLLFLYLVLTPGIAQPVIPPPWPYPGSAPPADANAAIQILDARYARGEIGRDDYLHMRQDLESRHG